MIGDRPEVSAQCLAWMLEVSWVDRGLRARERLDRIRAVRRERWAHRAVLALSVLALGALIVGSVLSPLGACLVPPGL